MTVGIGRMGHTCEVEFPVGRSNFSERDGGIRKAGRNREQLSQQYIYNPNSPMHKKFGQPAYHKQVGRIDVMIFIIADNGDLLPAHYGKRVIRMNRSG